MTASEADSYIKPGQLTAHVRCAECTEEEFELTRDKETSELIMRCQK